LDIIYKIKSTRAATYLDLRRFFTKYFDKKKLLNILPVESVILDIGASDGTDASEWKKLLPNASIHAFEPEPSSFEKLVKKTAGTGIKCHNIALGSFNDKAKFYISSGKLPQGSSLKKPTGLLKTNPQIKFEKQVEVEVLTLKDWLKKNSIEKVDFLWMDTQGTELDILKSSGNILDSVRALHVEISLVELYEDSALYPELKKYLEDRDFVIFEEIMRYNISGDVVFVKKSLLNHLIKD